MSFEKVDEELLDSCISAPNLRAHIRACYAEISRLTQQQGAEGGKVICQNCGGDCVHWGRMRAMMDEVSAFEKKHAEIHANYVTELTKLEAEIEARGLYLSELRQCTDGWKATLVRHNFYNSGKIWHETAPLALCAALLAYLKQKGA